MPTAQNKLCQSFTLLSTSSTASGPVWHCALFFIYTNRQILLFVSAQVGGMEFFMAQDSLIRFSEAIITDAEKKRKEYAENLKNENNRILNEKRKAFQKDCKRKIQRECDRLSEELAGEISKKRNKIKLELMELRSNMFEDTFAEVLNKLKDYVQTEGYKEYLKSVFNNAINEILADDVVCLATEKDIKTLKEEKTAQDIEFVDAEDDLIGGFILKSLSKHILIDCTFKERLESEKERFIKNSGLVIE